MTVDVVRKGEERAKKLSPNRIWKSRHRCVKWSRLISFVIVSHYKVLLIQISRNIRLDTGIILLSWNRFDPIHSPIDAGLGTPLTPPVRFAPRSKRCEILRVPFERENRDDSRRFRGWKREPDGDVLGPPLWRSSPSFIYFFFFVRREPSGRPRTRSRIVSNLGYPDKYRIPVSAAYSIIATVRPVRRHTIDRSRRTRRFAAKPHRSERQPHRLAGNFFALAV